MDDFILKGILFSIYGALLTKEQKKVYEYHILEDLSFSEIGEELSISRQAAQDYFKRADKKIKEYDDKLLLSKKFIDIQKYATKISKITKQKEIKSLSEKIIDLT
ncbi:MAG: sigma factor-like helix-turn-helix DNA-binding protein [Eubacteriales bacterium]|nr:sigma factor-like helix-turn-helix DNA-binding protein [Eubacteriales bacterium]